MKVDILDVSKNKVGEIDLPTQFNEEVRIDLVKRAVLALQSNKRRSYGAMKEAGKRASVKLSKRRRNYRGMYGFGISRTPRKILSRRGTRMYWVGAFAPNTVGGRRVHPPKAEKVLAKKINKKERKKIEYNLGYLIKRYGYECDYSTSLFISYFYRYIGKRWLQRSFRALKKIG